LVADAVIEGRNVDVQVERDGRNYLVVLRIVLHERVFAEVTLPIVWADLDEATRFGVLRMYVAHMIASSARTRRRAEGRARRDC
jgi:hypothetical protein